MRAGSPARSGVKSRRRCHQPAPSHHLSLPRTDGCLVDIERVPTATEPVCSRWLALKRPGRRALFSQLIGARAIAFTPCGRVNGALLLCAGMHNEMLHLTLVMPSRKRIRHSKAGCMPRVWMISRWFSTAGPLRSDGHDETFIRISPEMIITAATSRMALADSPKKKIPTRNAPTAPMPVQMV